MSKEIQNIYKNMNKYLESTAKDSKISSGLVPQRGAEADSLSVVNYVKQIRKLRGEMNVK
tara:strand:- start:6218 stop:6397 length:180 start_codon:yes stop_codon:yes gene_type:complete